MTTKNPYLFSRSISAFSKTKTKTKNKNVALSFVVSLLMSVNVYVSLVPLWNYKEWPAVSRHSVGEDKLPRIRLMHTKCEHWEVVELPSSNVRLEKQKAPLCVQSWTEAGTKLK